MSNNNSSEGGNAANSLNPSSLLSLAGFMGANMRGNMTGMPGLNHMRANMPSVMNQASPNMSMNTHAGSNTSNSSGGGGGGNSPWMAGGGGTNATAGNTDGGGHGGLLPSGSVPSNIMWGDMADSLMERGRSKNWTYEETMELINTYTSDEWQNKFSSEKKNHRAIWAEMADVLKKRESVTGDEARQRLNNLKALYNRIRRQLIAGEIASPQWEYWDPLHHFLTRPSQYHTFGFPRSSPPIRTGHTPPMHPPQMPTGAYPPMHHMQLPRPMHHPRMSHMMPHHMPMRSQDLHSSMSHCPPFKVKTESSPFDDSSNNTVPDFRVDVPGPSGTNTTSSSSSGGGGGGGGGSSKAPVASSRPVRTFDFDGGAAADEDGMAAVGGGQRSMMQDEESGSGGGSAGLCGIEAVVAAAAAAAAAADESSVNTATSSGGMVVTSGGAATSLPIGGGGGMAGSCQRPPVVGMSPPSAPTTPNKPESYQLRHNNHLSLVLNQLAEDEAFMDVTLTADGRQVKAHKSVLSAVSPYFSSVLRANPCQHPIIIMPRDIRYSELSSIIMYIYKGEMTVSAEDLPSLLKTAELLRITGLSPGENSNSQQQFSRHSSSSSNAFLSSGVNAMTTVNNQNTSISSSNNSISMTSRGSNSGRQQSTSQHQRSQESPISKQVEKMSKPQTTEIESPPPPEHTMLNPSDFMDLDMTCVKEELNSDNEEEDTETSSREVTTPPPMGNPPSPDKDKTSTSPHSQPTLDPDTTRSTRSPSLKTDTTSQDTNQEADDMKLNSLKTLANLASLDTPTNLSPSDSPSPVASYDPSPNVCPYCSEYVTGEQIKSHLSSKHAFKPAHVCDTCFRVYTKKNLFELHTKECSKES